MIDYQMVSDMFGAMAIWNDSTAQLTPYYHFFLQSGANGQLFGVQADPSEYYSTFTVRLQYYDGSMTRAGVLAVVETDSSAGYRCLVITAVKACATEMETQAMAARFNVTGSATKRAYVIVNPLDAATAYLPNATVPALHHFRLVHESPNYVMTNNQYANRSIAGGIVWVKSFEYVPGAVINGDGIIEVSVVTNSGRTFTYCQESVDGRFVVPYSTTDNPQDVKVTGSYTIAGTGETFEISEEAVIRVFSIN
jgi:dolichyl-diphosphooligosaccharide--protein glycosyltransferase